MNLVDFILIAVIAAAIFLAVRSILKRKKSGGCCSGGCSNCSSCKKGCGK